MGQRTQIVTFKLTHTQKKTVNTTLCYLFDSGKLTFSSKVLSATLKPPGTGGLILRVSLMTQLVYLSCSNRSMSKGLSSP